MVCPVVRDRRHTSPLSTSTCACLCGDVNNSCTLTGTDAEDLQSKILPNLGIQPSCTNDDSGLCGSPPIIEVRGCDVDASGFCSIMDVETLQSALSGIWLGATYPLSGGYDPRNCAQDSLDPIP